MHSFFILTKQLSICYKKYILLPIQNQFRNTQEQLYSDPER